LRQLIYALKKKDIKITEMLNGGVFLRERWEKSFANHMTRNEKEAIYLYDNDGCCGYLWHLFSYEKKDCLKSEVAEQAFNNEQKNECYVFYQHTNDAIEIEGAYELKATDLKNEFDVYVVDKDFSWTYVNTHETGWIGPFFCKKEK